MKRFREGLVAVLFVVGLMGFIGNDLLTAVTANAEEKGVKEEKAAKGGDKAAAEKKAPAKKAAKKKGPPPVVKAEPQISELAKSVNVDIMGTGFEADQELRVLFTDKEGMQTDIGYALSPETKANKSGVFFTTWKVDEFIKAKLVSPGAFTLTVTTSEFKPLAEANVFFKAAAKAPKKDEKKDAKKDDKGGEKKDGEKKEKKEKKSE